MEYIGNSKYQGFNAIFFIYSSHSYIYNINDYGYKIDNKI